MELTWMTAFIDRPDRAFDRAVRFWQDVTGSSLSPARGEEEEFATLVPPDGDAYLRVQRVAAGPGGCHLDLHVDDIDDASSRAADLGAAAVRTLDDLVVLTSPAGLSFCVVGSGGDMTRPAPFGSDGGPRSLVDQLCLDIAGNDYDAECSFWAAFTGWDHRPARLANFSYLARPAGMPLRILFHRADREPTAHRSGAHLDLACDDVEATSAAHEALGARVVAQFEHWTTMSDPAGVPYCVTSRKPASGMLPD